MHAQSWPTVLASLPTWHPFLLYLSPGLWNPPCSGANCLWVLCSVFWSNQTNQQEGYFFAWIHLLSSWWTLLPTCIGETLPSVEAQKAACLLLLWHLITAIPHHCLTAFQCPHVSCWGLLSHFLEPTISVSPYLMILCLVEHVLTVVHLLDSPLWIFLENTWNLSKKREMRTSKIPS